MHRWFFADDEILCKNPTTPPPSSPPETPRTSSTSSVTPIIATDWTFKVKSDRNLCFNEAMAICGSCPSLGNWNAQFCLPLIQNEDSIWTLTVSLPRKNDVRYRYLVVAFNYGGKKIVRFWETHIQARLISRDQVQDNESIEYETFGILNNKLKIDRGWLNPYVHVIQFKFYQYPFILKTDHAQLLLYVKMTPIKIKAPGKCENLITPIPKPGTSHQSKISNENIHAELSETFAYCEVASLQDQNGEFCKQPQYGTPCGPDNLLMFNMTLADADHTAFLIDLYNYSAKSGPDVPPNHFGYQYILPQDLKNSDGTLQLVIMCGTRHRPIGSMKCEYLVVKPMHSHAFNLATTFQRHWNTKREVMYIGHRGCGKSFRWQENILRENTIYSLNLAVEHGADMVEFDVQLTKDMVPILWHDLQLHVSEKLNVDPQECDIMQLPLTNKEINMLKSSGHRVETDILVVSVSRFTLEQLRRVRVSEPPKEATCASHNKNNQPFCTLEQVFKEVDCKTGFLMDIKWPQIETNGTIQDIPPHDFDKNNFIDAILDAVLKNAGSRRIVFTSFDADICTMVRLKQNLYPIFFLILPHTSEKKFMDPRGKLISTAIYFASTMELMGVHVSCSDLLETPEKFSNIHERDLCIFSWGREGRTEETRKYLKTLGVKGIIYGRINHVLTPVDLKQTIFYIIPFKKVI